MIDYLKPVHVLVICFQAKIPIKILFIEDYYDPEKNNPIYLDIYAIKDTYKNFNKDKTPVFIFYEDQTNENQEKELNFRFDMGEDEITNLLEMNPVDLLSNLENRCEKNVDTYKILGDFADDILVNHALSIDYYKKITELDPKNSKAHNNIGFDYMIYLNNPLKAIEFFEKAIKLDPQYARAYNNLGVAYSMTKNYNAALFNFGKSIEYGPLNPRALFNIGKILDLQSKEYELAIKYYNKAISAFEQGNEIVRANPYHSEAYFNLGKIYESKLEVNLRDECKAKECYENAKKYK